MAIVKLLNTRITFCQNLFTPGSFSDDAELKYSSTFLIKKDDPQVKKIKDAMQAVAKEKWDKDAVMVLRQLESQDRLCLRDGDLKEYPGFANCFYIKGSGQYQPIIFDVDKAKLDKASGRPYAGCYVNVSLEVYAIANTFGKRISASIRAVQFVADGEPLVKGVCTSTSEFDDLTGGEVPSFGGLFGTEDTQSGELLF